MDPAEKHPGYCNYCAPVIIEGDPYASDKAAWDSKKLACYSRPHPYDLNEGCGHFETCGIALCGSYYNSGIGEAPECLGCPAGSFPPRLVDSAITPVARKPALHCERACNRVSYHAMPEMKPFCPAPPPDAMWPVDDAMDCHFRNADKGAPWRYFTREDAVQRDNEIFADCVNNRELAVCPPPEKPVDCYLKPPPEISSFSFPPYTGGGGFGPCEEVRHEISHHPMKGHCGFRLDKER